MMLTNKGLGATASAFIKSAGNPLAERMLLALEAGQGAGGDIRGKHLRGSGTSGRQAMG